MVEKTRKDFFFLICICVSLNFPLISSSPSSRARTGRSRSVREDAPSASQGSIKRVHLDFPEDATLYGIAPDEPDDFHLSPTDPQNVMQNEVDSFERFFRAHGTVAHDNDNNEKGTLGDAQKEPGFGGDGGGYLNSPDDEEDGVYRANGAAAAGLTDGKVYDLPDISDKVARLLCEKVKESKIESNDRFLWALLKNPVPSLKRSFKNLPPRFYPGCYKWRWTSCTGTPRAPLVKNCGFFGLVRIENELCGVVSNSVPKSVAGSESSSGSSCNCDFPCLPFFDSIQNCQSNRDTVEGPTKKQQKRSEPVPPSPLPSEGGELESIPGEAGKPNSKEEVQDGNLEDFKNSMFPRTSIFLNHARAVHLCRAVGRTRSKSSFQVHAIPIRIEPSPGDNNNKEDTADECFQWKWTPCGADEANTQGSSCGTESCWPYGKNQEKNGGDDENQETNKSLESAQTCDIWEKIENTDSKCQGSSQVEARRKRNSPDALLSNDSEEESEVQRPEREILDEDGENAPLSTSTPMVSETVSSLGSGSGPGEKDTGEAPIHVRPKFPSICDDPSKPEWSSFICNIIKQSMGYDLASLVPVANRPISIPQGTLIECNWFAQLMHCTVIPSKVQRRRKRDYKWGAVVGNDELVSLDPKKSPTTYYWPKINGVSFLGDSNSANGFGPNVMVPGEPHGSKNSKSYKASANSGPGSVSSSTKTSPNDVITGSGTNGNSLPVPDTGSRTGSRSVSGTSDTTGNSPDAGNSDTTGTTPGSGTLDTTANSLDAGTSDTLSNTAGSGSADSSAESVSSSSSLVTSSPSPSPVSDPSGTSDKNENGGESTLSPEKLHPAVVCGLYYCYPLVPSMKDLEKREKSASLKETRGYVSCTYTAGVPSCTYKTILQHVHH